MISIRYCLMLKLNLGSGPKKGEGEWLNCDILQGADIVLDLSKGIPIAECSVDLVYSSHFLEHLAYPEICFFMKECYRILRIGGSLSVCVPDARRYIDSYIAGEGAGNMFPSFFCEGARAYPRGFVRTGSPIDWVNYIAYSNSLHKYLFDSENLMSHFRLAGFAAPRLRLFDPSLDIQNRDFESIYAVAVK